jgi:hypothetical protein
MSKRILFAVVVCVVALCCGQVAFGQATGSFQGTVTDKSGSAIIGASVRATSQATGAVREATTDDSGHYIITLLPVSIYTIRVEFKGFQTTESKDIRLQVDEQRELDFALAPASVSSTVEVVANAVAVETANPTLGQVITSQEVAQLPLNGRDFVQLATLTPRDQPQQLLHQRCQQRSGRPRAVLALGRWFTSQQHGLADRRCGQQ